METDRKLRVLTIFDMDDTILRTTPKVKLLCKETGEPLASLTTDEFKEYELDSAQKFDFSEFECTKMFRRTSRPIKKNLEMMNKIASNMIPGQDAMAIITARNPMDDHDHFVESLTMLGVPTDKLTVHCAGKMGGSSGKAKVAVLDKLLNDQKFDVVGFFDDSWTVLNALLEYRFQRPDIVWFIYEIKPDGTPNLLTDPRQGLSSLHGI